MHNKSLIDYILMELVAADAICTLRNIPSPRNIEHRSTANLVAANLNALIHPTDELAHYGSAYTTTFNRKFSVDEDPCARKKKLKKSKRAK